ncbi:MAG TPA: hypothetical protein VM639_10855 [Dongiaceae bacterium]|nr:hypothetical protein [Dongiaceae bacterium]
MANRSSLKSVDLQELITEAAKLELKVLNAGVDCWQVWINQVAKFSNIANDTLLAIEDDKVSMSGAARRFTEFSKENAEVLRDLTSRLSKSYFDEIDRLADTVETEEGKAAPQKSKPATHKKTAQPAAPRPKKAAKKAAKKATKSARRKSAAPAG